MGHKKGCRTSQRPFGKVAPSTKRKISKTMLERQAGQMLVIKLEPDSIEQKPDLEVLDLENQPIEFSDLVANQGL